MVVTTALRAGFPLGQDPAFCFQPPPGFLEAVEMLVTAGATIDLKGQDGSGLLHVAAGPQPSVVQRVICEMRCIDSWKINDALYNMFNDIDEWFIPFIPHG